MPSLDASIPINQFPKVVVKQINTRFHLQIKRKEIVKMESKMDC
jgi:hypothetical protein